MAAFAYSPGTQGHLQTAFLHKFEPFLFLNRNAYSLAAKRYICRPLVPPLEWRRISWCSPPLEGL